MKIRTAALRGRGGEPGCKDSWHLRLEVGEETVSNTIDSVQKDYLLLEIHEEDGIEVAGRETTAFVKERIE